MSPARKKKDTDPYGITASMKFVSNIADLEDSEVYGRPYANLARIRRKARLIRRKFKKKPGNIKRLAQELNRSLQEHYDDN